MNDADVLRRLEDRGLEFPPSRWTLATTLTGCRLTLEQTFDHPTQRGSLAAGWHLCLAVLSAARRSRGRASRGARAYDHNWGLWRPVIARAFNHMSQPRGA
jgi:hypothetical protein